MRASSCFLQLLSENLPSESIIQWTCGSMIYSLIQTFHFNENMNVFIPLKNALIKNAGNGSSTTKCNIQMMAVPADS